MVGVGIRGGCERGLVVIGVVVMRGRGSGWGEGVGGDRWGYWLRLWWQ